MPPTPASAAWASRALTNGSRPRSALAAPRSWLKHRCLLNLESSIRPQVRLSLPYDVAQQGGVAMITGTVTLSYGLALVVHDRTGGIWVDNVGGKYAPGDQVTVIGPVAPGRYSPQIVAPRVQLIGQRPLPSPKMVSFRDLTSGQEDAQYVAVEGTIRAVRLNPTPRLGGVVLTLAMPDGRVDAMLPPKYERYAGSLIDAEWKSYGNRAQP